MRFAVIGAGNMGCVYGSNLARIGEDVTLIDVWEEHVRQIQTHGLHMDGLSFHSGDLRGPGKVTHTNQGPTYLGELDGSRSERLLAMADLLARADLHPQIEDDIMATIWGKFVHNCGINAICAITGLRPGHIQDVPELDEFQTRIIEEALALAAAKGITLPGPDPLRTIKDYCAQKFHRVSMLQHLERGRRTEIDALNGYVVRESEKLGLSAPYNDALARLMAGRQYRPDAAGATVAG